MSLDNPPSPKHTEHIESAGAAAATAGDRLREAAGTCFNPPDTHPGPTGGSAGSSARAFDGPSDKKSSDPAQTSGETAKNTPSDSAGHKGSGETANNKPSDSNQAKDSGISVKNNDGDSNCGPHELHFPSIYPSPKDDGRIRPMPPSAGGEDTKSLENYLKSKGPTSMTNLAPKHLEHIEVKPL